MHPIRSALFTLEGSYYAALYPFSVITQAG